MSVFALGLNHTTAPLDLRGRFALAPQQLTSALKGFRTRLERVEEVAIVSTCNRTEVYVGAHASAVEPAVQWLAEMGGVPTAMLRSHAYVLEGPSAARHAFRVASGLDSMVLGEPQILGQLKEAVREAGSAGTLGTTLQQMFQRSFAVAKEVRSSTEIGAHSISMAAAAVRLASQLFEDLRQTKVLFVGAGEMIELAATHFAARQPRLIAVTNRGAARASELGTRFSAQTFPLVRPAGAAGRVRHRRLVHREPAADHRPGRGRACPEGAPAPADVHGRPGRAARRRARGRAPVGRLPLHHRRPLGAGADGRREARGRGRAGRGDHRDRRAELRPVARPARLGAADPGTAGADRRLALARDRPRQEAARRRRRRRRRARSALARPDAKAPARHARRAERRRGRRAQPAWRRR